MSSNFNSSSLRSQMNDLLNNRKTRIEALNDRINEADNELNKFLPKENEPENGPGEANLNTQKFINRMENILKDLNSLAFKSNIDNNQIQNEVNSLQTRSVLQMAIAKVKVQREREKYERNKKEREDYIKTLETEIVNNRIEMENLKKNQNENMVVISTLEDQIRILKSKVFGFDIAKKYEFYKDHTNNRNNPISNIRDENLAYAMWEKENYNNKNVNKLEKIEDEKNLWIRDSKNNIDKLIKDVNSANKVDLNNIDNRNSFNNNNGLMNSWSKKNYNNNYNNFNSDKNNSLGTHMRNYTPMILQNNNSYNNYNINGNGGNNNNNNGFNNKYNKF